jgi:hypothetical protein
MSAKPTIAHLTSFRYDEVQPPVSDALRYIYNLGPLLKTIAEMAEHAEDECSDGRLRPEIEQMKRLLWLAHEECERAEGAIFMVDRVLSEHIEHRVTA